MLKSIKRSFTVANFTLNDVKKYKKLLNFKQMLIDLGYDDSKYVFIQRMGSQSIHGTWSDLLACYLHYTKGEFDLMDNDKSYPEENYFTANILFALEAIETYVDYLIEEDELKKMLLTTFNDIRNEILFYRDEAARSDYIIVNSKD